MEEISPNYPLTRLKPAARRVKVLELLTQGHSEKAIAGILKVSYRTIKRYVAYLRYTRAVDPETNSDLGLIQFRDFVQTALIQGILRLLTELDKQGNLKASLNFRLKLLEKLL